LQRRWISIGSTAKLTPARNCSRFGICLWCIGRYQEACEDWVFENERFDKHETTYMEYGGITVPSLLLWASSHKDVPNRDNYHSVAQNAIKRRLKLSRTKRSGLPLACGEYLLGVSDEQTMVDFIDADRETLCWNKRESNLPDYAQENVEQATKWQLVKAYFYVGAKALLKGDIARYKEMLTHCLENVPPKPPPEFFLIAYELARIENGSIM